MFLLISIKTEINSSKNTIRAYAKDLSQFHLFLNSLYALPDSEEDDFSINTVTSSDLRLYLGFLNKKKAEKSFNIQKTIDNQVFFSFSCKKVARMIPQPISVVPKRKKTFPNI